MTRFCTFLAAVALLTASGCHGDTPHGHGDHGDAHGEHGHPHDGGHEEEAVERPDLSVTAYQDGLELFMEYPAFVVGQPSPLVAHFTDARDPDGFHVVTRGKVTVDLRYTDGKSETFIVDHLLRDGIFKPVVTPTRSGAARLSLKLEGEQVSGTVDAGDVVVHPDIAAAVAAAPAEEAGEKSVPFLKEQQWKTQYATAPAEWRALQDGVRVNGEIKAVAGQAVELAAPVAGRVPFGAPVPFLGQRVAKGELLAQVVPVSIAAASDLASVELELSRARAELGLAERELRRAQEMLAAKAVPGKQVDAARVARDVAAARLSAAERQRTLFQGAQSGTTGGTEGSAFELRSPIDGVVFFAEVMPGSLVEPGQRLVSVVNPERLWLEAKVFESDAAAVAQTPGASFTVAGFDREFTIEEGTGRLVAVGAVIDPVTRTVPVVFEFANPGGVLKPGMFAKVNLYTGATVRGLAVPESAVIDDNGKSTVFVMDGGESFFKRRIRPGVRSGGFVQVLEGVSDGERVVSRGAYEMKLSTATGAIPEHGHQH
jgi:cobalt-zinc-cadmium efflux system membrane fusion protein